MACVLTLSSDLFPAGSRAQGNRGRQVDLCSISLATLPPLEASLAPLDVEVAGTYTKQLSTTDRGLPVLPRWCVWVEPLPERGVPRWGRRWLDAVDAALSTWGSHLEVVRVKDQGRAQIHLHRRRPPRRQTQGKWRASHGRSTLQILLVRRRSVAPVVEQHLPGPQPFRLEPFTTVLVSPGQRREAIEATALHELGHAFGLWGHSDEAADAMAVSPGATPVLELSERDKRTLLWLQAQQTSFGELVDPDL